MHDVIIIIETDENDDAEKIDEIDDAEKYEVLVEMHGDDIMDYEYIFEVMV